MSMVAKYLLENEIKFCLCIKNHSLDIKDYIMAKNILLTEANFNKYKATLKTNVAKNATSNGIEQKNFFRQ